MHKQNLHDVDNRSVIGAAREVRLYLHDSRVVFCRVISPSRPGAESFVILPWGVKVPTTIRYDDVWRAASVTEMVWQRQKSISRAQLAGIFAEEQARTDSERGEIGSGFVSPSSSAGKSSRRSSTSKT